jgi:P-type conjugative transfer protein TrbL
MRRLGFLLFCLTTLLLPIEALAQGCGTSPLSCQQLAIQDAQAAGVDPATFVAQIQAESNFNPNAVNNASGATGIAQFLPSTAANAGFGIAPFNPSDPVAALQAAAQYDAALAQRGGSLTSALTAYSGGLTPTNPGDYTQAFANAAAADAGNPQAIAGATIAPTSTLNVAGGAGGGGTSGALGGHTIVTDLPGTGSGAGSGVLDQIVQSFQGATQGWQAGLLRIATDLFWLLAGIDLIASLIALVMGAGRPDWFDVVSTILHWLFPVGLFLWLMNNATTFMGDIVKSFQEAGTAIGGTPITPSAIFWAGINIVSTIWNNMHGFLDAIAEIPVMIAAIPIIIAFSLAAVWMLMVLIEAYFRIGLAALFLAFGGMRWTRNIATSLVMSCVAVGFKLLAMELIVGIVGAACEGAVVPRNLRHDRRELCLRRARKGDPR